MHSAVDTTLLRALDVLDTVPAGHIAVLVRNDRFEPHLHRGELAIVDTTDKERVHGELYVITIGSDEPKPTIVELIKDFAPHDVVYSVGIWYAFGLVNDVDLGGGEGPPVSPPVSE